MTDYADEAWEFHRDAKTTFNKNAESLLQGLSQFPSRKTNDSNFKPDHHISSKISPEHLLREPRAFLVDEAGNTVARFFHDGLKEIGLFGESHKDLVRLAENMHRTKVLRGRVTLEFVCKSIFEWLTLRHKSNTQIEFSQYMVDEAREHIKEIEIWIPIFDLHIQTDLTIGNVIFRTITRQRFDSWMQQAISHLEQETENNLRAYFEKIRKEVQGVSAATYSAVATPERAHELALEETEKSIAVLHLFWPHSDLPSGRTFCLPLGRERQETDNYFVFRKSNLQSFVQSTPNPHPQPWKLDITQIQVLCECGLEEFGAILSKIDKSHYEENLIQTLLLYSRAMFTSNPAEKVVYVFASLESMLLSHAEPIQQNLAERIAFLIGSSLEERIAICENVLAVYAQRSDFVHHARPIEDMDTLSVFLKNIRRCLFALTDCSKKFQTREELIDSLKKRKLA